MAIPILEYGGKHGLAYRHDWNAAAQLQWEKANRERQEQADAAAKVKTMAADMKYATVNNEFDAGELKAFSDAKSKEIGKLLLEHPDWQTNPAVYIQYQKLTHELQDNDIIRRATRFDQQAKALYDFIEKNPDMADDPDIQNQLASVEQYRKHGHVSGESYTPEIMDENGTVLREKQREIKEYTFTGLDMFNPQAVAAEWAKSLGQTKIVADKFGQVHSETQTNYSDLLAGTNDLLLGKNGLKFKNAWGRENDFTRDRYIENAGGDENMAMRYWLADMGKRHTNYSKETDDGYLAKRQLALQAQKEQKPVYLPFLNNIAAKQPGQTFTGNNLGVFNKLPQSGNGYTVMPGTKGYISIKDANGKTQLINFTAPQTTSAFPKLTFNNYGIKDIDGGMLLSYTGIANSDPAILRSLVDQMGYQNIQKLQQAFGVESRDELGELIRQQINKGSAELFFPGDITTNNVNQYDKGLLGQDATANMPYYSGIPGIKWSEPEEVKLPQAQPNPQPAPAPVQNQNDGKVDFGI